MSREGSQAVKPGVWGSSEETTTSGPSKSAAEQERLEGTDRGELIEIIAKPLGATEGNLRTHREEQRPVVVEMRLEAQESGLESAVDDQATSIHQRQVSIVRQAAVGSLEVPRRLGRISLEYKEYSEGRFESRRCRRGLAVFDLVLEQLRQLRGDPRVH